MPAAHRPRLSFAGIVLVLLLVGVMLFCGGEIADAQATLAKRFGFDPATNSSRQLTSTETTVIPCPDTFPAVITVSAMGNHSQLLGCILTGPTTIRIIAETNPANYASITLVNTSDHNSTYTAPANLTRFDMVNNTIAAPVMILGAVTSSDANTVGSSMYFVMNVSKNVARFDYNASNGNCSAFAMGITGGFLDATQIEVFDNDLTSLYGTVQGNVTANNITSVNAPQTGSVGSMVCATSLLRNTMCGLDPLGQSQCSASMEFLVGGVLAPFVVSAVSFRTQANQTWVRIHSNTIRLVVDPVTLVADASSAMSPTIYLSALSVVSTPSFLGESVFSFDSNDIGIYPAINANANSSVAFAASAVYMGKSIYVKTVGAQAAFQVIENVFTAQALDARNRVFPTLSGQTVSGGQRSTFSFLFIQASAQFSAQSGSTQTYGYNLVTLKPQLPAHMRIPSQYSQVTVSNVSRVGFADVSSTGGASIKWEATVGSTLAFDKNMMLIESIEAVSSVVVGAGFIPDGLAEIKASAEDTNHLVEFAISQSSVLSFQRSFVRLYTSDNNPIQSAEVSSSVSGGVTTNVARYIPFVGVAIPPSIQLVTSAKLQINRNVVLMKIGVQVARVDAGSVVLVREVTNMSACIGLGGGSLVLSGSTYEIGGNTLRYVVVDLASIVARTALYVTAGHRFETQAVVEDAQQKYVGPFVFAGRKSTSTGSNAGLAIDSASSLSLLENTAQVFDANDDPITKSQLGTSRTPSFIAGTISVSATTGKLLVCTQSPQEYLGTTPAVHTWSGQGPASNTTASFVTGYTQLDNNNGVNAVPVPVWEADCLPVLTKTISIEPVEYYFVESDRQHYIRIALSTTVTVGAGFLVVAMFLGGSLTEVQLFAAIYLSSCASHHDHMIMYVLKYFYSFFIDLGERDIIIAHSIIGPMIAIIWFVVAFVLSRLWEIELKEIIHQLMWPTGPLYVIKFLYPALVISSLRVVDTAGGIIGIVVALAELIPFLIVLLRTQDRYFQEQAESPLSLLLPNSTFSTHRGVMFLTSSKLRRVFMLTPLIASWIFGIFMMDSLQEALYGCISSFILIFCLCVLLAVSFVLLRPHGTWVRSGLYAWVYVWLGCTGLAVYDGNLNAKLAFAILFFCGILLLAVHTVLVWIYVFLLQESDDLCRDKPASGVAVQSEKMKKRNALFAADNEARKDHYGRTQGGLGNTPEMDEEAQEAAKKRAKHEEELKAAYYDKKKGRGSDDDSNGSGDDTDEENFRKQRAKKAETAAVEIEAKPQANKEPTNDKVASKVDVSVSDDDDDDSIRKQRLKAQNDKELEDYYAKYELESDHEGASHAPDAA